MSRNAGNLRLPVAGEKPETISDLLRVNERLWQLVNDALEQEERWQAERREWTEERASLRAMIDQVPDYLFVKDRQCRFAIANRAVAADLGAEPRTILGKTDMDLHPPDRAREFMEDEQRVLSTGQPMIDKEEFVLLKSGQQRWLSTSKLPLRDEAGNITGLVGIARDITLRKRAEEQVRFLAYYDPLTRLPNRATCEAKIEALTHALGPGQEARLMLIDLDRFKQVNDTLGHGAGDELLRKVADRLSELAGSRDEVSRLGGDEFVIVRSFADEQEETAFYDSIVRALEAPFPVMGNSVHVGGSVGISKVHATTTSLSALREADIALYEAKAGGRGQWQRFEEAMAAELEHRQQLETDLRHAVRRAHEQIQVYYQPVYDTTGTTVAGLEALVRWMHPSLGLLSPDQFIPLAEERGLITALGQIVLRQACDVLRKTHLPWVAVNVSPLQLREARFVEQFLEIVRSSGIAPERIQVEITEGMLVEEFQETNALLDRLRWNGVKVALDDFGTGYSSLSYLAQLQVDKIKIDRSFVSGIGSASGNAIVQAIVAFAKALNVTVTAEGVETEEQRRFVELAGCHEIQGYLFSRPCAEPELTKLLSHGPRRATG